MSPCKNPIASTGAQAGLNYTFNENIFVEAGYRYIKSNMEDFISGVGGTAKFENR